jgi:hypothetical protein
MEKDGGNSHHSRVGHFLRSMRVGIFGTLFVSRSECAAHVRAAREISMDLETPRSDAPPHL